MWSAPVPGGELQEEHTPPLASSAALPGNAAERDLIARARKGDQEAQAILYEQYIYGSQAIRGLLRRAVPAEAEREDLLHDIFLAVVEGSAEFHGESRLSTYLYRVAQFTILEAFRAANTQKRGGRIRTIGESEWSENPAKEPAQPPLAVEEVECRIGFEKLMSLVPEAYREALRLRVVEELEYQEIAERLSIPVNTVATRIFKGRAVLVDLLRRSGFRARGVTAS